ncbi:MAG TPA: LuxR C-terminal-related transcriptional regulator [Paludibacter sp.]|jgi:DNA-binding CsgD family transcriptional regulator|nr:LuxR C-terminal-related transcriptional regulator [Paludibacter sp.]
MKEKSYTYKAFLQKMGNASTLLEPGKVQSIIQHFKAAKSLTSRFAPVTFLLDFTTRKYLYVESTCFDVMGYTAEFMLETGFDEFNSKWHPADFNVLNTEVFFDNFSFLKTLAFEDYYKYIISYNYRFKNPNNEYINLLQRFSYIPGIVSTEPAGIVGVAFDITHFKMDTTIIHTIEEVEATSTGRVNKLVFKKVHPILDLQDEKLISKREKEILSLMAKGLSSKQIAAHVGISINTVNNHRKNMLSRTNCKSSSELMNYASKHGLA